MIDEETLAERLRKTLNREQRVAFAWRMALRSLPMLGREGHFDFWEEEERAGHALPVIFAVDHVHFLLKKKSNTTAADADATYAAADAAAAAPAYAAAYAYAAAANAAYAATAAANAAVTAARSIGLSEQTLNTLLEQELLFLPNNNAYEHTLWHNAEPENWQLAIHNFLKALSDIGLHDWVEPCRKRFRGEVESLEELKLRATIPNDTRRQGAKAAIAWLHANRQTGSRPLNEAKLILVGDGGAGKTSLCNRVVFNTYSEQQASTLGVHQQAWYVGAIRTNIWDFGGQEIQLSAHKFFMTERSLYVLVLDGRKEEEPEYWLEHIRSLGGDSPIMVVRNKIDQNPGGNLAEKQLRDRYPAICGFYALSCRSGGGIEDFTAALKAQISTLELVAKPFPNSWFTIKEQLEAQTSAGKNWISYRTFKFICEEAEESDAENQKALIQYLNDLGAICYFDDESLKHLQILNPLWLTDGVYKLLTSHITAQLKGQLSIDNFPQILAPVDKDDFRYEAEHYRYLLALMKKFELCYTQDNKAILIPAALQADPKLPSYKEYREQASAHYYLAYKDSLPVGIIHRLIVRMLNSKVYEAEDNDFWNAGIRLKNRRSSARVMVQANKRERCIDIWVIALQPKEDWLAVRDEIRDINSFFAELEWSERLMLGDDRQQSLDFNALLACDNAGKQDYFVPQLNQDFNVRAELAKIATPEEIGMRRNPPLPVYMKGGHFLSGGGMHLHVHNINTTTSNAQVEANINVEVNIQNTLDELEGVLSRALRKANQEQQATLQEVVESLDAMRQCKDKTEFTRKGYLGMLNDVLALAPKMEKVFDLAGKARPPIEVLLRFFNHA